jgi:hypothetical protein
MHLLEIFSILSIVFIVQFFMVVIAIGVGRFLIDQTINMDSEAEHLRIGACFFVGVAFIVVFIRTGTYISSDARLTVISVMFTAAIFLLLRYKKIKLDICAILEKGFSWPTFFIVTLIAFLLLFYWLPAEVAERSPFSSIGSLHSFRYAWVANLIYEQNNIPVISQNTAQSILAFVGAVFSFPAPFLYLYLWLISSIFFLSLFVYGIIFKLSGDKHSSIFGLIIFMIGNTALSTTHVLTIDSGFPYLLSGYSDTLFGVFSIFFLLLINEGLLERKTSYNKLFIISFLIVSFNFYCAPQNVIFIPLLIFCFYFNFPKKSIPRIEFLIFWLLVLLSSSLISAPQGGMLTHSSLLSDITYSGIMSPSGGDVKGLSIRPGIPFHYGWFGNWQNGWMINLSFAKEYLINGQGKLQFFNQIIWNIEQILITSIRIHFFPIFGLLFMCLKLDKIHKQYFINSGFFNVRQIGFCGNILFLTGFIFCFPFALNGYKWELSRFLIPGISIGMLGISLAAMQVTTKIVPYRIFLILISLFLLFGPAVNLVGTSIVNTFDLLSKDVFSSHVLELIGSGPIVNWK